MITSSCTKVFFNLIECLLVITTMSLFAGTIAVSLSGIADKTKASSEINQLYLIKTAVENFRKDTGYYPKTGPFSYKKISLDEFGLDAEIEECWFESPANLVQLFKQPTAVDGTPVMSWNSKVKRGWNGPYINLNKLTLLVIGDNKALIDPAIPNEQWKPDYEPPVVVDPALPPPPSPDYFLLPGVHTVTSNYSTDPGRPDAGRWPQQYFYITTSEETTSIQKTPFLVFNQLIESKVEIVSFGADGLYNFYTEPESDDVSLTIY